MNGTTIIDWFIDSMSSNTIKVKMQGGNYDIIANFPKKRIYRIKIGKTCYIILIINTGNYLIWAEVAFTHGSN